MTDLIVVSYSELDALRQCPLKHELAYKKRWRRPSEAGGALARGTLWHLVMQAHYECLMRLQGGPTKHVRPRPSQRPDWMMECRRAVAHLLCDPNTGESSGDQELIDWMYDGYLMRWGLDAGGPDASNWQILGVEIGDVMPMPLPNGAPSSRFALKTKIDLVVRDLADGQIRIVDHKSGQNLPYDKDLDLDDQFGLYQLMLRVNRKIKAVETIHNAARTQRNKGPMALADRFARTGMRRSDEELREIARDALSAAVHAYRRPHKLGTYSAPNPQTCSWRCDFRDAHLLNRKGVPWEATLPQQGFEQDFTRH